MHMRNTNSHTTTPKIIRKLLYTTSYASIFFALIQLLFFTKSGPLYYLSLSWSGLKNYYFWQPFTYFFINSIPDGISISWLMTLAIGLYLIWFFGSNLCDNFGEKAYLKFYLISGIITGILTILFVPIFRTNIYLSGQASVILPTLTVWLMKNKHSRLYMFHLLPFKTQTLIFIGLGIAFLFQVDDLNFVYFLYYVISILIGYIYGLFVWTLHSPFTQLHDFEKKIHHLSWRISSYFVKK